MLLLFWTGPAAACAGKIVSTAARRPLFYNPFAPLDAQQGIAVKVQNAGSDRCAYQLSVPSRSLPLQFATGLRFAIMAGGWQETLAAVTPVLQPRQSYDLHLTLLVYRGHTATAGTLSRLVGFSLTPMGGRTPVDEIELNLSCVIPPLFQTNLAGSGTRTSLEFSNLNANATKSVVMQTRATQGHRLEFQSTAGYLLREGSPAGERSTIPFVVTVDGQTYALSEGTVLRIPGTPGQTSHLLTVKIGDTRTTGRHLQSDHHGPHCIRYVIEKEKKMKLTLALFGIVAAIFVASLQLPVFYTANPDYVKRIASVAALEEFKDGDLVSHEAARIPSSRDQVAVPSLERIKGEGSRRPPCQGRDPLRSPAQDQFALHRAGAGLSSR